MKNNLFEIIVGTFVLGCAIYFFFLSFNKSGISASQTYQISAKFNNIDGVGPGSDVKISGVKVGTVVSEAIDPITYQAILKFDINRDIKLSTDSSIKILSSGLLGGKYLAIEIGGEEEILKDGDKIQFTQSGVNFEELLGKFIFGSSKQD